MKTSCNIIQDLLPSYLDGICSEESVQIIEEHFKECESCKRLYKEMKQEPVKEAHIKEIKPFQRIKRRASMLLTIFIVLLLIALLYSSPVQYFIAKQAMTLHLNCIPNHENYHISEISLQHDQVSDRSYYMMRLNGKGKDDYFSIQYDRWFDVSDSYHMIQEKENMVFRISDAFRNEMETLSNQLLPKQHYIMLGSLYTKETTAYLKKHYENNIVYDKDLFKNIPLTFGLHVSKDTTYEEALKEALQVQNYFHTLGFDIAIYNISFDDENGDYENYSGLSKEDLNDQLPTRLYQAKTGNDKTIQYETNRE